MKIIYLFLFISLLLLFFIFSISFLYNNETNNSNYNEDNDDKEDNEDNEDNETNNSNYNDDNETNNSNYNEDNETNNSNYNEDNETNNSNYNEDNETNNSNYNEDIRVLHLVLYSDGPEYNEMKLLTNSYYKMFKNIDTVYYTFSNKDYEEDYDYYDDKNNTLYIKGKESYLPGILDKSVKAFLYFKNSYKNYDYIIRTNISTLVNFKKLSRELYERPIHYGGGLINHISKDYVDEYNGITKNNNKKFENLYYPSGTCMIFSRELFEKMLIIINQVDYSVVDDVSVGEIVRRYFPNEYKNIKGYNEYFLFVEDVKDIKNINNYIFFRNRNKNRKKDVENMRYLIYSFLY